MAPQSGEYAVIGIRLDGTIVVWNRAAEQLYGYSANEVLGSHVERLYAPTDVAVGLPAALVSATLRRGRWHGFARRLRSDGTGLRTRALMVPIVAGERVEHIFEVSVVAHSGKPMALQQALAAVRDAFPLALHRAQRRRRGRGSIGAVAV